MTTSAAVELPNAAYERARRALGYGLEALVGAEPLVPFSMTWNQDEVTIERFKNGAYDDCIEQAMRVINSAPEGTTAYAVVWSGYVEVDGSRRQALVAEVAERSEAGSVQLAQPYRLASEDDRAIPDGDILGLGAAENLLQQKFTSSSMPGHLLKPAYVSTEAHLQDVRSQPFAQMPVALICLAANLFPGEETERVTLGIRKLQALEARASDVDMARRVFTVITAAVSEGDLMRVLPTDSVEGLTKIVLGGAAQLNLAIQKGLVWEEHAKSYFRDVRGLLVAVLTNDGSEPPVAAGERLLKLFDSAVGA